ncbi:MAG: pyruvate ferredoxin oxidoreductase subunit gamma [Dehalococcoidales bacterium]|nr:pyruvate ferredoxin oxidoreductase subunit gamma [Dehalococcoidales bacterium]MDZ4230611.1 pyruvate ferredoxin oxidoreductase subunit gamma [Dehalococcoidales bacterium]
MIDTGGLVEIRWHGRGGQGAVTSAELIAQAAINEGKYAQAFPSFGPERRGAPVLAFDRINQREPIRIRAEITQPDVVIVLDPGLLTVMNVAAGLKEQGIVIINTRKTIEEIRSDSKIKASLALVDATSIAREVLGVPIVNTTMVGALIRATGIIKLESMNEPIEKRFGRLAERNIKAMEKAYQETLIVE